jgi:hypothetical protein
VQQRSQRSGKKPPSSVAGEFGWLGIFLVLFVITTYLMLRFIVPLHFNDRVAIMISAIITGVVWVLLRSWWIRRARTGT